MKLLHIILFLLMIILFAIFYDAGLEPFETQDLFKPFKPEYLKTLETHSKSKHFPFRYFTDENKKVIPLVAVTSFFRDDEAKKLYKEYQDNGVTIIGITAYKSFPNKIKDGTADDYTGDQDFDYVGKIKNWLCCFNDPKHYGFTDFNNIIDISESDFYDAEDSVNLNEKKKYDVIYSCPDDDKKSCPKDGWNAVNRNFELAKKCFVIMIRDFGLNVLVIGRTKCGLEEQYGDKIKTVDFLPWDQFQQRLRESRILFVPNVADASPRVIAEAMTKNVPVLMNRQIMCGSKYVTAESGELFTDETDVAGALKKIVGGKKDARKWWQQNYSKQKSAVKLCDFVKKAFPDAAFSKDIKEIHFVL
jgi:hypothetical protein